MHKNKNFVQAERHRAPLVRCTAAAAAAVAAVAAAATPAAAVAAAVGTTRS